MVGGLYFKRAASLKFFIQQFVLALEEMQKMSPPGLCEAFPYPAKCQPGELVERINLVNEVGSMELSWELRNSSTANWQLHL